MYDDVAEESGYDQKTLEDIKYVSESVKPSLRNENLGFHHHKAVAPLDPEKQKEFLEKAVEKKWTVKELREQIRDDKHKHLKATDLLDGKFDVIYADPPWQYEHATGDNRTADKEYPVMSDDQLCSLVIPAAENSVLFLWSPPVLIKHALVILEA